MKDLSKVPLINLIDLIADASKEDNQELVNEIALEIKNRLYVPNKKITEEQMLKEFGYKEIEKSKKKFERRKYKI